MKKDAVNISKGNASTALIISFFVSPVLFKHGIFYIILVLWTALERQKYEIGEQYVYGRIYLRFQGLLSMYFCVNVFSYALIRKI